MGLIFWLFSIKGKVTKRMFYQIGNFEQKERSKWLCCQLNCYFEALVASHSSTAGSLFSMEQLELQYLTAARRIYSIAPKKSGVMINQLDLFPHAEKHSSS
jgi:hypothetical protein